MISEVVKRVEPRAAHPCANCEHRYELEYPHALSGPFGCLLEKGQYRKLDAVLPFCERKISNVFRVIVHTGPRCKSAPTCASCRASQYGQSDCSVHSWIRLTEMGFCVQHKN